MEGEMDEVGRSVAGYDFGAEAVARSPLGVEDLDLLKQTVLFTEEDEEYLRLAGDVLEDQADEVLDLWYGFVGSHPHLVYYFSGPDGEPDADYLARVRERFKRWIVDTCRRPDRKSTRLNSSHANISYAVFCLKKQQQITLT